MRSVVKWLFLPSVRYHSGGLLGKQLAARTAAWRIRSPDVFQALTCSANVLFCVTLCGIGPRQMSESPQVTTRVCPSPPIPLRTSQSIASCSVTPVAQYNPSCRATVTAATAGTCLAPIITVAGSVTPSGSASSPQAVQARSVRASPPYPCHCLLAGAITSIGVTPPPRKLCAWRVADASSAYIRIPHLGFGTRAGGLSTPHQRPVRRRQDQQHILHQSRYSQRPRRTAVCVAAAPARPAAFAPVPARAAFCRDLHALDPPWGRIHPRLVHLSSRGHLRDGMRDVLPGLRVVRLDQADRGHSGACARPWFCETLCGMLLPAAAACCCRLPGKMSTAVAVADQILCRPAGSASLLAGLAGEPAHAHLLTLCPASPPLPFPLHSPAAVEMPAAVPPPPRAHSSRSERCFHPSPRWHCGRRHDRRCSAHSQLGRAPELTERLARAAGCARPSECHGSGGAGSSAEAHTVRTRAALLPLQWWLLRTPLGGEKVPRFAMASLLRARWKSC